MHKVFISYHHAIDQPFKEALVQFNDRNQIFIDKSVDTGDVSESLNDETIREKIRDEYLRDSTVTILLAGTETSKRKHIDWELYSSMIDGRVNKKSGIIVINLPKVDYGNIWAPHGDVEQDKLYPHLGNWQVWSPRTQIEEKFPYLPARIIDNLASGAKVSVVGWQLLNVERLKILIELAHLDRGTFEYTLVRRMRRHNS